MSKYNRHEKNSSERSLYLTMDDAHAALKWLTFTIGGTISAFLIPPLYAAMILFPNPGKEMLSFIKHPCVLGTLCLSILLSIWFCLFRVGQLLSDFSIRSPRKHIYASGILLLTTLCMLYMLFTTS